MPSQYQRNKAALNHFVSVNNETEYRDTLADRGTALGDQMTQGTSPTYAFGSPVIPVALMPEIQRPVHRPAEPDLRHSAPG